MEKEIPETDIIILGHIAKDINVIDGISKTETGGPVFYGGIAGAHMGIRITVITRLRKKDFSLLKDFKKYGIPYFAYPAEGTSGLKNIYSSKNLEERICKPLDFAGLFKKEEIPIIKTKYFVLGPILAGEIDLDLLEFLSAKYKDNLCLDIQGFIRVKEDDTIIYCTLSQKDKEHILSKINILKLDRAEALSLTGKDHIDDAAKELLDLGPKELLLTHEQGITLYTKYESFFFPWQYKCVQGRTGRGDTAFISYVGARISQSPKEALKFSVALTSLKLESAGPFILPLQQVIDLMKTM